MNSETISALIALAGVVFSAIVSFIVSAAATRFNYKQLFAETVSKNRMEWINVWRENISTFLACAEILHEPSSTTPSECAPPRGRVPSNEEQTRFMLYQARAMITSRLNMEEELHKIMFSAINTLDWSPSNGKFAAQREYILETARQILKPEWERVKHEAKGKNK